MKVLLLCYGGLSTGLMKTRIEQQAQAEGYEDVEVRAQAIAESEADLGDYDVYLLGPQVRYAVGEIKAKAGEKPVLVISPQDFGMMRGDAVWKQIKEALNI